MAKLMCERDSQRWGTSLREAVTEVECVLCEVCFSVGLDKALERNPAVLEDGRHFRKVAEWWE